MKKNFRIKIKYQNNYFQYKYFKNLNDIEKYIDKRKNLLNKNKITIYYKNINILNYNYYNNSFQLSQYSQNLVLLSESYCSIWNDVDDFTYKIYKIKPLVNTYFVIIDEYTKFPGFIILNYGKKFSNYSEKNLVNILLYNYFL